MATAIEANKCTRGLDINGQVHMITMFAGYMAVLTANSRESLPELMREIHEYKVISGLHINNRKSELLYINTKPRNTI